MSASPPLDGFAVANLADSADRLPAWRMGVGRCWQPVRQVSLAA
jgi:hypothetical protein